jgi:hypothetical protein
MKATPALLTSPHRLSTVIAILLCATALSAFAQGGRDIYQFGGGVDGAQPIGTVVFDSSGSLYGITSGGGVYSYGTVYKLSPPSPPGGPWIKETLYNFTHGTDGGNPFWTPILDKSGRLYGVTGSGGDLTQCSDYGCGTIFQLTPPERPGDPWTETTIYTFHNEIGLIGLTLDATGALYTAATSWAINYTYAFRLSPPTSIGGAWAKAFVSTLPSSNIVPDLVFDDQGALYGLVWSSAIFKLSPPADSGGKWTFRYVYDFDFDADPYSGPVFDRNTGHLFGTVPMDGLGGCGGGCGLVYELAETGNVWHEKNIYNFRPGSDGSFPMAAVTFDDAGTLYTTSSRGKPHSGPGSVIRLERTNQDGPWTETTLWNLTGGDGDYGDPRAGVVVHGGNLFGTTKGGGAGFGAVFEVNP